MTPEQTINSTLRNYLTGAWVNQPLPPAGILEQRVLELENLGMLDVGEGPDELSSIRLYATASLLHHKPPFFISVDPELLRRREMLERLYGLAILTIQEAVLLLKDVEGAPN